MVEHIDDCTHKNTKSIYDLFNEIVPFKLYECKVLKVYDGDTIWVALDIPNIGIYKLKLRFNLIDTAEIRGSSPATKREACRVKEFVSDLILDKKIIVEITGVDPFQRWLANIYPSRAIWNNLIPDNSKYLTTCINTGYYEDQEGQIYLELNRYMLNNGYASLYEK